MRNPRASIFFLILLAISLVAPSSSQVQADSGEWQVEASTDDTFKFVETMGLAGGTMFWFHSTLVLENGMRWLNITIPQGSVIESAYIRWHVHNNDLKPNPSFLTIKGDDEDDCLTFSTWQDFNARPRTDAFVEYDVPQVVNGQWYNTSDLSEIIQEIMNRPAWVSGNALAILTGPEPTNDVAGPRPSTFDFNPDFSPMLFITWGPAISPPSDPNLLFGAGFNDSSPYVELHWNHSLIAVQFFEVQNSSDGVSWTYLGQSTTANYTDSVVINGTERYYRVRANNQTGGTWYNSSFSDVDFEKVHFIPTPGSPGPGVNLTGIWTFYNLTEIGVTVGTLDSGDLNSTLEIDGDMFNVSEVVGVPGMLISGNFSGIDPDAECLWVVIYAYYDGNMNHDFDIEVWNFTSSAWVEDSHITDGTELEWFNSTIYSLRIPNEFLSGGEVRVRLDHEAPGNINHDLFIEYFKLVAKIPAGPTPGAGAVTVTIVESDFPWIAIAIILMCVAYLLLRPK